MAGVTDCTREVVGSRDLWEARWFGRAGLVTLRAQLGGVGVLWNYRTGVVCVFALWAVASFAGNPGVFAFGFGLVDVHVADFTKLVSGVNGG